MITILLVSAYVCSIVISLGIGFVLGKKAMSRYLIKRTIRNGAIYHRAVIDGEKATIVMKVQQKKNNKIEFGFH